MMVESGTIMESLRADSILVRCRRCCLREWRIPRIYGNRANAGERVAEMKAIKPLRLRGKGGHGRRLER